MDTLHTLAQCTCTFDTMAPENGICQTCDGTVSWYVNNQYNQHFGYSGYDEDNDHDEPEEDYDE